MKTHSRDFREQHQSYVDRANRYIDGVLSGEQPACKWVRLACERQRQDLARDADGEWEWTFDINRAGAICRFIERLPHVEGRWKSKTIEIGDWQCFLLTTIFGWVDRQTRSIRRFRKALVVLPRKNAKALALDTPIATPGGWTTMGEIRVGDVVFDERGNPCSVTHMSEVFTDHDCYEVEFSNGERITADAGHLWLTTARVDAVGGNQSPEYRSLRGQLSTAVRYGTEKPVGIVEAAELDRGGVTRVRTTEEIFRTQRYGSRGDRNHSVRMPGPLNIADAELPIEPYLLGAWLGDGSSSSAIIHCGDQDRAVVSATIRSLGYEVVEHKYQAAWRLQVCAREVNLSGDALRVTKASPGNLVKRFRGLGVIKNKHIPGRYLRASRDQRLDLLRGLMDTDGTINKSGRVLSYTTTLKPLADGVSELLSSLGIKHSTRAVAMVCNGLPVDGVAYLLQFMAFRDELEVFSLPRKLTRMRYRRDCSISPRSATVQIASVRKVDTVATKCIAVDSPSHLFLAGKSMLPTHNTTMAAAIALYLLVADHEPGAQVYSAAKTRDQARIAWGIAHKMVARTPDMKAHFGLEPMAHSITCEREGAFYKPLSRDADSLEGLNVHGAIVDELHVHPDREVWDVIDNGITARTQPLIFAISTEGDASAGIFVDQVKYAQAILDRQHEDDSYFAIYYGLDIEDDWSLESSWEKANPNWGVSVSPREMRDKYREATQLPSAQATFLTKRLNVRVGAGSAYFNMLAWRQLCKDESLRMENFRGEHCIVTVDLASKSDLTCAMKVFRRGGHYYVFGSYYLPEGAVEPGMPNHEFYRAWRLKELLNVTEGPRTDYEYLERELMDFHAEYRPQRIGGDPNYNAEQFRQHMEAAGVTFVEIPHSVKQFSEPMKDLAALIVAGRVHHNGDPILDWAMGNVTAKTDAKGNVYPRKDHPDKKIDPAVALIANMSEQMRLADEASMYEDPLTAAM